MKGFLYFLCGFGIGSGVSYFLTKRYYEKLIKEHFDEERDAMKSNNKSEHDDFKEELKVKELVNNYISESDSDEEETAADMYCQDGLDNDISEDEAIHPITYDDFCDSEHDYYTKIGMTYYADGILVDDSNNERIYRKAAINMLGVGFEDFDKLFKDDDVFYIRDDKKRIDYEIARDDHDFLEENYDEYYDKP